MDTEEIAGCLAAVLIIPGIIAVLVGIWTSDWQVAATGCLAVFVGIAGS